MVFDERFAHRVRPFGEHPSEHAAIEPLEAQEHADEGKDLPEPAEQRQLRRLFEVALVGGVQQEQAGYLDGKELGVPMRVDPAQ